MARLISYDYIRQKALADPDSGEAIVYLQDIADAPTVYALEVVRCRECKYHEDTSVTEYEHCCLLSKTVRYNDFCSYGDRKEGAGNG